MWYLASLLTATGLAIVAPLLVYIYPPSTGNKKLQLKVTLDKSVDELGNKEGIQFNAPKNSAFIMYGDYSGSDNAAGDPTFGGWAVKDQGGQLHVLAVRCPHLGCSVGLQNGADHFLCPCHGSEFSLDGKVVHGPAVAPMSYLKWQKGQAGNEITVEGMEIPGLG